MRNLKIRHLLAMLLACALVSDRASAQAVPEQVLREFPAEKVIHVEPGQKPDATILEVDAPGIRSANYELRGQVQYDNVQGAGHLEMWSNFPDGKAYFSRTLGDSGPMKSLSGTSPPRSFVLPFTSREGYYPSKLTVRVVLPGGGSVKVWGLKLVQINQSVQLSGWWDNRTGGWVGGALGSVIGLLGGLIGVLNGWQRTRPAALVIAMLAAAVSIVLLLSGTVALSAGQPYHVWYPLVLCGVIGTVVLGGGIWIIRRQCAEYELRKMSAMDAPR